MNLLDIKLDTVRAPYHPVRSCRKVRLLERVELSSRPNHKPRKYKGAAARGIAFEKSAGKWARKQLAPNVKSWHPGQWFSFSDINGFGYAQTDYLAVQEHILWIFECKLTYHPVAVSQLNDLYGPLCSEIWPDLTQIRVVIARHLIPDSGLPIIHELSQVFESDEEIYLCHLPGGK